MQMQADEEGDNRFGSSIDRMEDESRITVSVSPYDQRASGEE